MDILGRCHCVFLILLFCAEVVEVEEKHGFMGLRFDSLGIYSIAWRLVYDYNPDIDACEKRMNRRDCVSPQANYI